MQRLHIVSKEFLSVLLHIAYCTDLLKTRACRCLRQNKTKRFATRSFAKKSLINSFATTERLYLINQIATRTYDIRLVRQGRAKPAKWVFRGNSTPPPRGAGWIAQTYLGVPTGQWGAGWKEYVTIWTCIQQSWGARKRRLLCSLTHPVCGSLKIPFGIDATVMFTVLFNAVWVYCDVLDPRVCTEVIRFSKFLPTVKNRCCVLRIVLLRIVWRE